MYIICFRIHNDISNHIKNLNFGLETNKLCDFEVWMKNWIFAWNLVNFETYHMRTFFYTVFHTSHLVWLNRPSQGLSNGIKSLILTLTWISFTPEVWMKICFFFFLLKIWKNLKLHHVITYCMLSFMLFI